MNSRSSKPVALFVHGSADLYGSDRVLLNVVGSLVRHPAFEPWVLLHEDGPLRIRLEELQVPVFVTEVGKITRSMWGPLAPIKVTQSLRGAMRGIDALVGSRSVAFVYSNTLAVLAGAVWARRRKVAHVWHVHEIVVTPQIAARVFPKLVHWMSDRVICNSSQTRTWLVGQAPGAASISTVVVNGLGPLPLPNETQADAFRGQLGLSRQHLLLTVLGRLNRMKGQELLIEALALLRDRGEADQVRLAVVGDVVPGQESIRARLGALVVERGLQDLVRFVPFTDNVFPIWQATDIAVVPSLEPESFGLVAIEAMACGKPVVAAAHGGMLDIVDDGHTGLLFEPRNKHALADALSRLLADVQLRNSMGAAGALRQRREFDLLAQITKTRRLCEEVAAT